MLPLVGTDRHAELLSGCLERMNLFRLSRQLDVIDRGLSRLVLGRVG